MENKYIIWINKNKIKCECDLNIVKLHSFEQNKIKFRQKDHIKNGKDILWDKIIIFKHQGLKSKLRQNLLHFSKSKNEKNWGHRTLTHNVALLGGVSSR